MSKTEYIQFGIGVIYLGTLVVILGQVFVQNRIFKAQMLKDRFEMYWKTVEPVSEVAVRQLTVFPADYMDASLFKSKYQGNDDAIRKYIYVLQVYEYLAFTYGLKRYHLPDPLGYQWTEAWTHDLLSEPEFLEIHTYHKGYYPYFASYVDGLLSRR